MHSGVGKVESSGQLYFYLVFCHSRILLNTDRYCSKALGRACAFTVTQCGRICLGGRKINFSKVFAGQKIGIREVDDKIWLVSFMHYDLGYFDEEAARVEPGKNPFGAKVLPMS